MIYKAVFLRLLRNKDFRGTLEIEHKKKRYSFGNGPKVSMKVTSAFFRRVILFGDIGFGESFFNKDMETDNLEGLILWFIRNKELLPGFHEGKNYRSFEIASFLSKALHLLRRNTKIGSRKNIKKHYDISNDFYRLWLDETMTYSCAVFKKGMSLKDAQENKYRKICRKARLKKGDHVLEIGTGWGGFSIFAAREYGCRVTTVTISKAQHSLAKRRIKDSGLEDMIELRLQDYREIKGSYDKIISVEMMEALGHQYVPLFMKRCSMLLKDKGLMCCQVITFPDEHFQSYLKSQDYIKKHIFPGGELLSVGQIRREADKNSLQVKDVEYIGPHYAKTLNMWRKNYVRNKKKILSMGFDEKFYLKWLYYFIYCEVGFMTGYIDDAQIIMQKR